MSAVEAAATLQDYMDTWTHRKITGSSSHDERPNQSLDSGDTEVCEQSNEADEAACGSRAIYDEGFEYVEGEDETLPWKCAACEFIDPAKQVVVDHWQRYHCAQVSFVNSPCILPALLVLRAS